MFSFVLVLVEEVMIGYDRYRDQTRMLRVVTTQTRRSVKIGKSELNIKYVDTNTPFSQISPTEQHAYTQYYTTVSVLLSRRLMIMARESASQLCLQNAVVVYQYFHHPLYELSYQSWRHPTAIWSFILMFRILSILLSAYSTFKPIIEYLIMKSHKQHFCPPTVSSLVIKVFQTLFHIFLGTGIIYLIR